MDSRRVGSGVSLVEFLEQNLGHILIDDLLTLTDIDYDKLFEGGEVVIILHDLDFRVFPQAGIVLRKRCVELRQMVLEDELAQVVEPDAPDHDDRCATSVLVKADFSLLRSDESSARHR